MVEWAANHGLRAVVVVKAWIGMAHGQSRSEGGLVGRGFRIFVFVVPTLKSLTGVDPFNSPAGWTKSDSAHPRGVVGFGFLSLLLCLETGRRNG